MFPKKYKSFYATITGQLNQNKKYKENFTCTYRKHKRTFNMLCSFKGAILVPYLNDIIL